MKYVSKPKANLIGIVDESAITEDWISGGSIIHGNPEAVCHGPATWERKNNS